MAYIGNSPANTGNYQLVDDIASSFNGTLVSFALTAGGIAITPAKSGQILANINGVMQEPDDTGTNGFKVTSSNIVFSSAPASSDTFWAVYQGQNVDIGTPSDDVVDTAHIKDDAVTADKLANSINTEITANTAKVGITSGQAGEITANTAKTGITSGQASAITANTAKTGITSGQASAITANTAKVTNSTSASDLTSGTLPTARLPAGSVIQVVNTQLNVSHNNTTSTSWVAASSVTASITPSSTNSRILVMMTVGMGIGYTNGALITTLARGSTIIGSSTYGNYAVVNSASTNTGLYHSYVLMHTDSPSSTSSTAYNLYFKSSVAGQSVYATHSGSSVNVALMEIAG